MVSKLLIPAIDIYNGMFVRLKRGNYNKHVIFNKRRLISKILDINPHTVHIVDLEGARYGGTINRNLISSIIYNFSILGIKTQVGGGIRSIVNVKEYVLLGSNIILGTSIFNKRLNMSRYFKQIHKYIIISIDFKSNHVYYNGWESKGIGLNNIILHINNTVFLSLIFTDIYRDGTLNGIDISKVNYISRLLCKKKSFLFAGGFNHLNLPNIREIKLPNFLGFISGKFIYYGK
ncbi:hypothetical protein JSR06_00380 [Candidatus Vidania fulgoroideae]|uniref:1-(5-phosphoribosyl)-5-((5-phosphoribosylamino)methylideneamino)imidazole-4-carboxamide isomerase n=1 Tax=Candidatus Vidania fulgoroideorum TaxID=881286 RepID=A0A975AE44_9PROT|nr:hypothetical protein JSR06_00380 [Candidatus Vidania fulgoroideae]